MRTKWRLIATFHRLIHSHWSLPLKWRLEPWKRVQKSPRILKNYNTESRLWRERLGGFFLRTATKIKFMYSHKRNCAASVADFQIHVSVSDLYIPRIDPHIFLQRKGRTMLGIYKSLTDTFPFLGTFVLNFRFCVFAVHPHAEKCSITSRASLKFSKFGGKFIETTQKFIQKFTAVTYLKNRNL